MYEDIAHLIIKNISELKIQETKVSLNIFFTMSSVNSLADLTAVLDSIDYNSFEKCEMVYYDNFGEHYSSHTLFNKNITQKSVQTSLIGTLEKNFSVSLIFDKN